ncbi:DUF3099 domain-containing protein [Microbacterium elymi]|uniref:DUF3099 domain-containing protein n=1 Tax=Microbacterium elymi TaxID=2909587 RepID=A0ABY5NJ90_9MICO|nr:DUF3099 domain-containing protein [Microbacterium elymi]UUT35240.1 DUF3099 domain-containing protein [Microbacterium elymi]
MKTSSHPQSATSLPRPPRDELGARSQRYLITMGVRVVCFLLMVFVQPFGWYTWVFGVGAVFLPYIAVVLANVGQDSKTTDAVTPERALDAKPDTEPAEPVIRVRETPAVTSSTPDAAGQDAAGQDAAGQDAAGQDETGQDETDQETAEQRRTPDERS